VGVAAVVILLAVSSVSVDPSYWMLSTIQVSCPNLTDPLGYELIPIYTKYGPIGLGHVLLFWSENLFANALTLNFQV